MDVSDWLEQAVRNHPDRLFLSTPAGSQYTYADLRNESGRIASALRGLGVVAGDRVVVRVEKSPTAVLLYVACLRMGAAFVPVNTAYSAPEVEYFLADSKPRVAVVEPADLAVLAPLRLVEHLVTLGTLVELAQQADPEFEPPRDLHADSLAAIVYTSGTTGRSKGAMLTRGNLASNAATLAASWRFTGQDTLLHVLPLFHVHGCSLRSTRCSLPAAVWFCCPSSMLLRRCGISPTSRYSWECRHTTRGFCRKRSSIARPPPACACLSQDRRRCLPRLTRSFRGARVTGFSSGTA